MRYYMSIFKSSVKYLSLLEQSKHILYYKNLE